MNASTADRAPGPTEALAHWAASLRHDAIPADTLAHARRQVLDTMAVAWAGTGADGADVVARIAAARSSDGPARLWGSAGRAAPADAALLNGIAAAALDWDGVHETAGVHAGAVLLPALLASAQARGASGRELLVAYVAGAEAMTRLGAATTARPGWFYTSVLGVIACALACGRLAGLDADGLRRAMGIALSRAGGTQQPLLERSLTKRMQSAFAARDGLECALLAGCGVSAPREALEGPCGVAALYGPMELGGLPRGLGESWTMRGTAFKAWPSCLCNHAAIAATLGLLESEGLAAEDVGTVLVEMTPAMHRLVGAPFEPGNDPQVAAQFSAAYSVACVLLRRRLSVTELAPAAVLDPRIAALTRRITLRAVASWEGAFAPARVTVTRRDGRTVSRTATDFPGARGRELDLGQLVAKARACFAAGARPLTREAADGFVERLLSIDLLADAGELFPE